MPYYGVNQFGNSYISYEDGSYWYGNEDGSSYADDGNNHYHWTDSSGQNGWHYNGNQDYYTSGQRYRDTDTRHGRR